MAQEYALARPCGSGHRAFYEVNYRAASTCRDGGDFAIILGRNHETDGKAD